MSTATAATTALFVALVLVVLGILVRGLRHAKWGWLPIASLGVVYLVVPAVLARAGMLDRYSPLPAPALLLLLGLSLVSVAGDFSPLGTRVAVAIAPAGIVVLQSFRVAVEWLLHRLYLEGAVPVEMTYSGRNWDVVSGLTGLVLGIWLLAGRPVSRVVLLVWNVLGLSLLLNIVTVAILATPVRFRQFTGGPPNLLPSTFPCIWLPSFLVQLALASHVIVFRQLIAAPDLG